MPTVPTRAVESGVCDRDAQHNLGELHPHHNGVFRRPGPSILRGALIAVLAAAARSTNQSSGFLLRDQICRPVVKKRMGHLKYIRDTFFCHRAAEMATRSVVGALPALNTERSSAGTVR